MTQIEKLQNNLQKCRDIITYKGGTVGDTTGFNHLAKEIETIPAGNADYVLVEDNSTVYEKQIMAGALPKAKLRELGGMTYKWKGITYSTVEGQPWDCILVQNLSLEAGTYTIHGDRASIVWSKNSSGGYGRTITVEEGDIIDWIRTEEQAASETGTFTIYPYFVRIDVTPNVIVPFPNTWFGLRDAKPTAIINHGANLFDASKISRSDIVVSNNGQTITMPILTIGNGYTETKTKFGVLCPEVKVGDTIIFNFTSNAQNKFVYFTGMNYLWYPNQALTITQEHIDCVFTLYGNSINNGQDGVQVVISDFRINRGTTVFPFTPYRTDIEVSLPKEITSWLEWGKGISGYANTYDFVNGKYIQRVYTQVMTGRQYWWEYGTGTDAENGKYCYACDPTYLSGLAKVGNFQSSVCNTYNNVNAAFNATNAANQVGNYSDTTGYPNVYFITDKPTVEEWRAHLTALEEAGTPVLLTYALAEPIITDGPIYPNIFDVEGGDVLEFVNDHKKPVPSTITYLRRTV
jgi:hypothetical protein